MLFRSAGPYMLIYSRAAEEPVRGLDWPPHFRVRTKFIITPRVSIDTFPAQETCESENIDFIERVDDCAPEKAEYLRATYRSVNIPGLSLRSRKESIGTSDASVGSTSTAKPPSRSMSVESSRGNTPGPGTETDNSRTAERMEVEQPKVLSVYVQVNCGTHKYRKG